MASHASDDVEQAIAQLAELGAWELRNTWRRLYRRAPPMRISRDLLLRGIAYRLQEQAFGRLSKPMQRKLIGIGNSVDINGKSESDLPAELARKSVPVCKPGTRLVRQWHDRTYTVEVLENGFRWDGEIYSSLTPIAKRITGSHWSGPRFFGLTKSTTRTKGPTKAHSKTQSEDQVDG